MWAFICLFMRGCGFTCLYSSLTIWGNHEAATPSPHWKAFMTRSWLLPSDSHWTFSFHTCIQPPSSCVFWCSLPDVGIFSINKTARSHDGSVVQPESQGCPVLTLDSITQQLCPISRGWHPRCMSRGWDSSQQESRLYESCSGGVIPSAALS